jgi:hypothetical protein
VRDRESGFGDTAIPEKQDVEVEGTRAPTPIPLPSVRPLDRLKGGQDVARLTVDANHSHGIEERVLIDNSDRSALVQRRYRDDPTARRHFHRRRSQMVFPNPEIRAEPDRHLRHSVTPDRE